MLKVRTTMQPWLEIEVTPADYLDLSRQGLLVTEPKKAEAALPSKHPQGK